VAFAIATLLDEVEMARILAELGCADIRPADISEVSRTDDVVSSYSGLTTPSD
jgi:hypothetical protein